MMTPELRHYKDIIYLAETHDEFIICIEKALKENDDSKRRQRIEFAQNNTWDKRIETLLNIVNHEI